MKHLYVYNFDIKLYQKLKKHLKFNGVSIKFFVQKAIAEKLERDMKKDEK